MSGVWNRQERGVVSVKPQMLVSVASLTNVVHWQMVSLSTGVLTTMLLTLVPPRSRSAVVFQGYVAAYQSRYRSLMDIPSQASATLSEANGIGFLYAPPESYLFKRKAIPKSAHHVAVFVSLDS